MSKGTKISKSSSSKPSSLLKFFGCCGDNALKRDKKNLNQSMAFPASQMDILNPPNKPFKGSIQGHYPLDEEVVSSKVGEEPKSLACLSHAYPLNEVFVLGKKSKIVAYMTRKKLNKDSSVHASLRDSVSSLTKENLKNVPNSNGSSKAKWSNLVKNCASIENKKEGFLRDERGTNSNASYHTTPDNLGAYLGHRLKCNILLNLACGSAEITKNLASYCNYMVAMDKDLAKLNLVKSQAEIQDVIHKIEFVNADLLQIKYTKADMVYIDPLDSGTTPEHNSFEDIKGSLSKLISKALKCSNGCIAVKLPSDTNIEELPEMFSQAVNEDMKCFERFCIEIEEIVNTSQEVENIIVYFGDCSSIEVKDEHEAIYEHISSNQQPNWRFTFPLHIMGFIFEKIGVKRSLRYISEIEEIIASKKPLPYSFFDAYLDKALSENVITTQELVPIIKKDSKKSSSFIFSIANSYTSNLTLLQRGSSLISSQYNLIGTVEDSRYKKVQNRGEKEEPNPFLSQGSATQSSRRGDLDKANLLDQYNNAYNEFYRKKPFSLKDLPYKDSVNSQEANTCFDMHNLEHSLSSAGGEFMKEFATNPVSRKPTDELELTITENDLELSGIGMPTDAKRVAKRSMSRSKSFKVREVNGNYQTKESDESGQGTKNKENSNTSINKGKDESVKEMRKSEFFVKKKNAFFSTNQA